MREVRSPKNIASTTSHLKKNTESSLKHANPPDSRLQLRLQIYNPDWKKYSSKQCKSKSFYKIA